MSLHAQGPYRYVATDTHGYLYNGTHEIYSFPHDHRNALGTFFHHRGTTWFWGSCTAQSHFVFQPSTRVVYPLTDPLELQWLEIGLAPDGLTLWVEAMVPFCQSEYFFYDLSDPRYLVPLYTDRILDARGTLTWQTNDTCQYLYRPLPDHLSLPSPLPSDPEEYCILLKCGPERLMRTIRTISGPSPPPDQHSGPSPPPDQHDSQTGVDQTEVGPPQDKSHVGQGL